MRVIAGYLGILCGMKDNMGTGCPYYGLGLQVRAIS